MSGIISLIKGFFEFVISAIGFAIKLIKDLVYVVQMLGKVALKIPSYLSFMPTVIISMFVVCISVVIVYKVIGRD